MVAPMLIKPLVLVVKIGVKFGVPMVELMLPVRVSVLPKVTVVFVAAPVAGCESCTVVPDKMAAMVVPPGMLVPVTGMPTAKPFVELAPLRVRVELLVAVVELAPVTLAVRMVAAALALVESKVKSFKLELPHRLSTPPPLMVSEGLLATISPKLRVNCLVAPMNTGAAELYRSKLIFSSPSKSTPFTLVTVKDASLLPEGMVRVSLPAVAAGVVV